MTVFYNWEQSAPSRVYPMEVFYRTWRAEQQKQLVAELFGSLPTLPAQWKWQEFHRAVLHHPLQGLHGATLVTGRILMQGVDAFAQGSNAVGDGGLGLQLWIPAGSAPRAVILNGDACWHYASDAVKARMLTSGFIFAQFNRTELFPDPLHFRADDLAGSGLKDFGAIAVWAWGYLRCVDVLQSLGQVRADQIAIVGHSRGGKAALLAGAWDERIALTSANNSGAAGAGSIHHLGAGAESLIDLVRSFPHWLAPACSQRIANGHLPQLDMHTLQSLIAPRALLLTQSSDDRWANPAGTARMHQTAAQTYASMGVNHKTRLQMRTGPHAHALADWEALLEFAGVAFSEN
jgi:hypothetical protein